MGEKMDFKAYGCPLTTAFSFKYLGMVLSASGNDWPETVDNIQKAHNNCSRRQDVGGLLKCGGSSSSPVSVRDVGHDPIHRKDDGGISPLGIPQTYGQTTTEGSGWDLEVPPSVYGNGRGCTGGDGD